LQCLSLRAQRCYSSLVRGYDVTRLQDKSLAKGCEESIFLRVWRYWWHWERGLGALLRGKSDLERVIKQVDRRRWLGRGR